MAADGFKPGSPVYAAWGAAPAERIAARTASGFVIGVCCLADRRLEFGGMNIAPRKWSRLFNFSPLFCQLSFEVMVLIRHCRHFVCLPVSLAVAACLLSACQKAEPVQTTAERLKNVEVAQQTQPDSYLPRKSVDYMANMKNIKDAPDHAAKQEAKPQAEPAKAAPAPVPAPAQVATAKTPEVKPAAAPEVRPAPAAAAPAPAPAEPAKRVEVAKADTGAASQTAYFANLRNYIAGIKRYPTSREARQQRPSGTVVLWVEVTREGKFKDAGVEQSSSSIILDQAALSTVRQGSYPAFPADAWPGQASRRFTLGLEYAIDSNG